MPKRRAVKGGYSGSGRGTPPKRPTGAGASVNPSPLSAVKPERAKRSTKAKSA